MLLSFLLSWTPLSLAKLQQFQMLFLTFASIPRVVFSCNLFSYKAPNLTFLHPVYFSAFTTNLFSFSVWFILLFHMRPHSFLEILANEPCEPAWFLFLTPLPFALFLLYLLNLPFFTNCVLPPIFSIHTDHFKVQFLCHKTLTNWSFCTLCVWKPSES